MNENELAMSCGVETFLQSIGLQCYAAVFLAKGYDRETDLQHLGDEDLDTLMITDLGHRRALLSAARRHTPSEECKLLEWLREHDLEHYFIGFVRSELIDMEEVARLNLPDENIYDELEISMPGHIRRLERAVRQLNKRRRLAQNAEVPVTEGFWGKPRNLEDAKYDFLCVEATISSTLDASRSHKIDFMVDSGSDVTTLQEDLLYTLNPELIGPINSKGVHSSRRKNLYKAKLTLGTQDLIIEVMGESYNSLGSRVLRHFRHYITGSKHIWLPGDFFDPTMITELKMDVNSQKQESQKQTTSPKDSDPVKDTTVPSTEDVKTTAGGNLLSAKTEQNTQNILFSSEEQSIRSQDEPVTQKTDANIHGSEEKETHDCYRVDSESTATCKRTVHDGIDGQPLHNGHSIQNEDRDC